MHVLHYFLLILRSERGERYFSQSVAMQIALSAGR